jgi:hypothetical protein
MKISIDSNYIDQGMKSFISQNDMILEKFIIDGYEILGIISGELIDLYNLLLEYGFLSYSDDMELIYDYQFLEDIME